MVKHLFECIVRLKHEKEEGRRKKEEGRRKKEEGRRKKEEGRREATNPRWEEFRTDKSREGITAHVSIGSSHQKLKI